MFRWTIPERRVGDRNLPTIPTEIYLEIFEHLAPSGEKLSVEQTKTLTRVSGSCKLFCHIALPRIFEHVDFVGLVYYRHDNLPFSRNISWCSRMAAGEDLALWGAECTRECNFRDWQLESEGSWAVNMFAKRFTSSLSHMTNLRRLTFTRCFITNNHWRAVMALRALGELAFDKCQFTETAQLEDGIHTNHPMNLRVPSIEFYEGGAHAYVAARVFNLGHLRSLKTDLPFAVLLDWPQDYILEQLHLSQIKYSSPAHEFVLRATLRKIRQSVAELKLSFYDHMRLPDFEHYLQSNLSEIIQKLRSLTLVVDPNIRDYLQSHVKCPPLCFRVGFSESMEKLIVQSHAPCYPGGIRFVPPWQPSSDHLQQSTLPLILADFPNINYVEIYGTAIRLKGDSWVEAPVPYVAVDSTGIS